MKKTDDLRENADCNYNTLSLEELTDFVVLSEQPLIPGLLGEFLYFLCYTEPQVSLNA